MTRFRIRHAAAAASLAAGLCRPPALPAQPPAPPTLLPAPGAVPAPTVTNPAAPVGGSQGCAPGPRPAGGRLLQLPPPAPPPGFYVGQWYGAEIAKAEAQKLFVTAHEWYLGGATLGPAGRRHVGRLARGLLDSPGVVYLEPAADPKLDPARQAHLVTELLRYGVKDAERRVVAAYPPGEGLYAEDALVTYPRLFTNRGNGGGGGLGGNGGLGGLGGGLGGGGGSLGGLGGGFGVGGNRGY